MPAKIRETPAREITINGWKYRLVRKVKRGK